MLLANYFRLVFHQVLSILYQVSYQCLLDHNNLILVFPIGDGPNCGHAIAIHQHIDKVAFTGSVEVNQ
jgi:delta 1-pyrroline-5-carboxylate dehydrogenase